MDYAWCCLHRGFVENTDTKWGLWHYFMMGQNEETLGAGRKADREYSSGFETLEERNAANRAEGIKRIANRGIRNNILFYTYKNFQNYDDGCFAPVQKTIKGTKYGNSFIERIFSTTIQRETKLFLGADNEETAELTVPMYDFGDWASKMKAYRKKNHITQQELAQLMGVKHFTLRSWEQKQAKPPYNVWRLHKHLFDDSIKLT